MLTNKGTNGIQSSKLVTSSTDWLLVSMAVTCLATTAAISAAPTRSDWLRRLRISCQQAVRQPGPPSLHSALKRRWKFRMRDRGCKKSCSF